MKQSAFTLIELLAVLVVLGMLSLLIIPNITSVIEETRENLYEIQLNNIITGTKNWSAKNTNMLPEENNETITLTLGQLKIGGFIDQNFKNPKTNKPFPNDLEITITKINNNYKYQVIENSGGNNDSLDPNSPTIILKGQAHEIVEIFSEYVDSGVIAKDPSGALIEDVNIQIKSNNLIVNSIDTSKLVQYKITYSVTYNGVTSSAIRTVTVKDTTPPVLNIPGNTEISVNEIGNFNVMAGVSATDNSLKMPTITVSGNLSAIPGKYFVKYTATDESGNSTTKTRIITVKEHISIPFFDE